MQKVPFTFKEQNISLMCDKSLKVLAFKLSFLVVWAITSGSFIFWNQEARG